MIRTCAICAKVLNDRSDPSSQDCGGDCLRCMAMCGDPECEASIARLDDPETRAEEAAKCFAEMDRQEAAERGKTS